MTALLQMIIRQPVTVILLLVVLCSYSSQPFGIDSTSTAEAFALSTQNQLLGRRPQHHLPNHHDHAHAVHSSNTHSIDGAFCTLQVAGRGLPMTTKSQRSCHRLYSSTYSNSRLAASSQSNNHDDNADIISSCSYTIDEYNSNSIGVPSNNNNCNNSDSPSQQPTSTVKTKPIRIQPYPLKQTNRRTALLQFLSISLLTTSLPSQQAQASSEIDTSTGELFSPKNQMIKGGGSIGGRGIPLKEQRRNSNNKQSLLKTSGLIQSVYETRFITYLTRFLLVYDPAARAWWKKNRARANQLLLVAAEKENNSGDNSSTTTMMTKSDEYFNAGEQFAEFAESVEIGLADYFVGSYGSYASVAAAKAGLDAVAPARSSSSVLGNGGDGGGDGRVGMMQIGRASCRERV